MESLFNFRKKRRKLGKTSFTTNKQQYAWKHKFVYLAHTEQRRIPISEYEIDQLLDAGLGEREVEFHSQDMDFEEIKDVLIDAFPRLKNAGGFQFFKCTPNKRTLEPLSKWFMVLSGY